MKTMLDLALEYTYTNCKNKQYVQFNQIFEFVEKNLHDAWELLVNESKNYDDVRLAKIGELYRLLTVDSRFERNLEGEWTTTEYIRG